MNDNTRDFFKYTNRTATPRGRFWSLGLDVRLSEWMFVPWSFSIYRPQYWFCPPVHICSARWKIWGKVFAWPRPWPLSIAVTVDIYCYRRLLVIQYNHRLNISHLSVERGLNPNIARQYKHNVLLALPFNSCILLLRAMMSTKAVLI